MQPTDIETMADTAQLLKVQWRKAHNYWSAFTKTFLAAKEKLDSGMFGTDPKTGLEWNMARFLAFRAGFPSELGIIDMISIYHRTLAEEDKNAVEAIKAEKARERRQLAEQRRQDNLAAREANAKIREQATATLVPYDRMCRSIAEAYKLDDVKDYIDKAAALKEYMRRAKNTEAERQCAEIRVRAERRAGEILATMEKAKGTRGQLRGRAASGGAVTASPEKTTTLSDLGITGHQSADWQKLAAMPQADFEAAVTTAAKPSASGIIMGARRSRRRAAQRQQPDMKETSQQERAFARVLPYFETGKAVNRDKLAEEIGCSPNVIRHAEAEAHGYLRGITAKRDAELKQALTPHRHEYVCKYCGEPKP